MNGQVFHSYGYGYTLLAQPHAVRSIRSDGRWDPEELVRIFPQTLGREPKPPPAGGFGTKLDERPAEEWSELAPGRRFWKSLGGGAVKTVLGRVPRHYPECHGPAAPAADAGGARRRRRHSRQVGGIANYARDGMLASLDARLALRDVGIRLGEDDFASTGSAGGTATSWPRRT